MQALVGITPLRFAMSGELRNSPPQRSLAIRNIGAATAYVGRSAKVAQSGPDGGLPIRPGELLDDLQLDEGSELWIIADSPGTTVAAEVFERPA